MLTNSDLKEIKNIVDNTVNPLSKDIKDVKKRVRKIEKTVDIAIKMLNEDDVKLIKRVTKIEGHLGLSSDN